MAEQNLHPAIQELVRSDNDSFFAAAGILLKFANNVLDQPNEPKYRRIRLGNKQVMAKLLPVAGAMECLFAMGFEETEDREFLCLPQSSSLDSMRRIHNQLDKTFRRIQQNQCVRYENPSLHDSERNFLSRITSSIARVRLYEDPTAQAAARGKLPMQRLMEDARKRLEQVKASGESSGSPALDLRDCMLLATLHWFKQDFFSWVDSLPCERCGGQTMNDRNQLPNSDDLRWGAGRVEGHRCPACGHITRFPRYTNAVRLLTSRRGRCGEWADCFTLICRALGYEARYVLDWTDHVWTEVYSNSQQRWLHCDPCEAACDKPLLYEAGWGKKLTYVLAFSKDEVQDVSWRYSAKHTDMLKRRTMCRESWLRQVLYGIWKKRLPSFPEERRKELNVRLIAELSEFLATPTKPGEALPGRISGSAAWRAARGEMGDSSANNNTAAKYVFKPSDKEAKAKLLHVTYSSASDTYNRPVDASNSKGWGSWLFSMENAYRKEESDHQMAYLAREDGSKKGEMVWRFEAVKGQKFAKLEMKAACAEFSSGKLQWRICAGDETCIMKSGEDLTAGVNMDLEGNTAVVITAVMRGGDGEVAWQHAQLFRQKLSEKGQPAMDIKITIA